MYLPNCAADGFKTHRSSFHQLEHHFNETELLNVRWQWIWRFPYGELWAENVWKSEFHLDCWGESPGLTTPFQKFLVATWWLPGGKAWWGKMVKFRPQHYPTHLCPYKNNCTHMKSSTHKWKQPHTYKDDCQWTKLSTHVWRQLLTKENKVATSMVSGQASSPLPHSPSHCHSTPLPPPSITPFLTLPLHYSPWEFAFLRWITGHDNCALSLIISLIWSAQYDSFILKSSFSFPLALQQTHFCLSSLHHLDSGFLYCITP